MTEERPKGWHRSLRGFVWRTIQAADENKIPFLASALTFDALLAALPLFLLILAGLSTLLNGTGGEIDPTDLLERFLPPHEAVAGVDPFRTVEELLRRLTQVGRSLSLVAIPAFLWFSTRLFAGIRTALGEIYDVQLRPVRRHFAVTYLLAKLRDLGMVGITLVLVLVNAGLSTGLALLAARGQSVPGFDFLVHRVGRFAGEVVAFGFLLALFFTIYHFASVRRPPWRATLVGTVVAAVLFEIAKRLFGLYLRNVVTLQMSFDANAGALILFVIWMYYTAVVFLLGAVIAETWELRELQRAQRG
ncbi:MAG: YihY/virulence factor BrkB family protein [Gemmatimonadales bacterium]